MFFKNKQSVALSSTQQQLIAQLTTIVGQRSIITNPSQMGLFCNGFRYGSGKAIAVVQPHTLLEQWQILKACVQANAIMIMQAANTGLTGGSTPDGNNYDRDIVLISTMNMKKEWVSLYIITKILQKLCALRWMMKELASLDAVSLYQPLALFL